MSSPDSPNIIPSPRAPSIAPSIRSASSINHALLNQLARPSPSPTKSSAALNSALQDVLRDTSGLDFHSARQPGDRVRVPYSFPPTASQRALTEVAQKEQRFKNLVVLALVLVAAGSVGQYCAAAEAGADARIYAGVLARVTHKREWDLACLKEREGKTRARLSSPVESPLDNAAVDEEDGMDENSRVPPGEEEEIPHLVDLEVKQDRVESDLSWCVNTAQVAMIALASALKWFEDRPSANPGGEETGGEDDDGIGSQASNPFLEASRPKPTVRSSPAQGAEEEEEQKSSLEQLSELLKLFVSTAQLSLFIPYGSGDFDATSAPSSSTQVPIKHVLHNEQERMKTGLPVDHDRVSKELGKAWDRARKSEKKWDRRRDDAAQRAIVCLASVAKTIGSTLEGDGEEFEGVDGEDSDDSEEDLGLKAVFIVTLGVVQVTLVACLASDKRPNEAYDYTHSYPSSVFIPYTTGTASREEFMLETARVQKESRVSRARRERVVETGRRNVRASLANVVCQTLSAVWKNVAPETQRGEWGSDLAFWSDMEGLGDDDAEGGGSERGDEEGREFDELERKTLAALKLLGFATFKLLGNLYKGTEGWQSKTNVNATDAVAEEDDNDEQDDDGGDEDEDENEHSDPERMGKLSGSEEISSWLKNVSSSPSSTPQDLDISEETHDEAPEGTSRPSALQMILDARQQGEANLLTLHCQIEEDTTQYLKDHEEQTKAIKEQGEREQREFEEEMARNKKELEKLEEADRREQESLMERIRGLKRKFETSANPEGGKDEGGAKASQGGKALDGMGEDVEDHPAETKDEEDNKENIPTEEASRAAKKQKQSKNAKIASIWKSSKRGSRAKKEASMKALEKARESIALKKQQQLVEERARAEREKVKEEERRKREESGESEPPKKKRGNTKSKRRSKAQKENLAKAVEAARVKRAQGRVGQA